MTTTTGARRNRRRGPAPELAPRQSPEMGFAPSGARSWYVTEHKIRQMRAYAGTLAATAIGTPVLYLFAFGVGLATLITGNVGPTAGVAYLEFVAPALLATAGVLVAMEEYTFGILLGLKWNATYVAMNATPLSPRNIVNGIMLFVLLRMTLTTGIYFLVMVVFGAVHSPWGILTVVAGLLAGFAFSPVAAYAATIQEDRGQFAILQRVVILPLTLFSGTVFPLTQLPIFLQWIGWLSPLWHASQLGRQFLYGPTEPIWLTVIHVVYLVTLGVVGWQLCVRNVAKRLNK